MCCGGGGSAAGAGFRPRSGPAASPEPMAARAGRLVSHADFSRVYREGRRYPGETLVLYLRATAAERRVGVTAGRRLGGAVVRNRAKRRLREAFRRVEPRLCGRGDIVLVARSGIAQAGFAEIVQEMNALCAAGRLKCGDAR